MPKTLSYKYDVKPTKNLLELVLYPSKEEGPYETLEQILTVIERLNLPKPIDPQKIQEIMDLEVQEEKYALLKGEPPQDGEDAYLKLYQEISDDPVFIPDHEGERVNYREAIKFQLIHKDEKIATLVEPKPGKEGRNIFDKPLSFEPGKPLIVKMGEGVRQEGADFFATISGRPKYKDGLLQVLDVLEIEGNVNMKTGNIKYPGIVIINGDLEDTFEIHSDSDVKVMGTMGDALIHAKGNVTIAGGVVGNEKAKIISEGFIEVKFAQNAILEAKEDILFTKEARHCQMASNGFVRFQSGGVIGGEIVALNGVEAPSIGAESSPKTSIRIGFDYEQEKIADQKKSLFSVAEKIESKFKHILEGNTPLEKEYPLIAEGVDVLKKIEARIHQIDMELEDYQQKFAQEVRPLIKVSKVVYANVKFLAPHCMSEFHDEVKGAKVWTPNIQTGKFSHGGSQ